MDQKTDQDYCCVLDILFQQNQDFAMFIPKTCSVRAAFRKTMILPDKKTITKMKKMSNAELKTTLFQYILREPRGSSISSILEKGSGIIESFDRSYYYEITKNSKNEIMFNGSLVTVTQLPDKHEKIIHAIKPVTALKKKEISKSSKLTPASSIKKLSIKSKKGGCVGGSCGKPKHTIKTKKIYYSNLRKLQGAAGGSKHTGGSVACCPWGGSKNTGSSGRKGAISRLKSKKTLLKSPITSKIMF